MRPSFLGDFPDESILDLTGGIATPEALHQHVDFACEVLESLEFGVVASGIAGQSDEGGRLGLDEATDELAFELWAAGRARPETAPHGDADETAV